MSSSQDIYALEEQIYDYVEDNQGSNYVYQEVV